MSCLLKIRNTNSFMQIVSTKFICLWPRSITHIKASFLPPFVSFHDKARALFVFSLLADSSKFKKIIILGLSLFLYLPGSISLHKERLSIIFQKLMAACLMFCCLKRLLIILTSFQQVSLYFNTQYSTLYNLFFKKNETSLLNEKYDCVGESL